MTQHIDQLDLQQANLVNEAFGDFDEAFTGSTVGVPALRATPPVERLRTAQVQAFEQSRLASFKHLVAVEDAALSDPERDLAIAIERVLKTKLADTHRHELLTLLAVVDGTESPIHLLQIEVNRITDRNCVVEYSESIYGTRLTAKVRGDDQHYEGRSGEELLTEIRIAYQNEGVR